MDQRLPENKKKYVFGKFDAGQKADFFGTVFLITGLSFTGFVVWMKSFFSTGFVELNFLAHDVFAVLALLLFIMHILFAVYYRALHGIIFGDVDDEGAQKNYPNWFEKYRS